MPRKKMAKQGKDMVPEEETPEEEPLARKGMVRVGRPYEQLLPVRLTDQELRAKGSELAEAHKRHRVLQDDKKAAMQDWKARLERSEADIDRLAGIVRAGEEDRAVQVQAIADLDEKSHMEVRLDTREVVTQRQLRQDEVEKLTQMKLFSDGEEPVACPHGEPPAECNACMVNSDLAYDASRESALR